MITTEEYDALWLYLYGLFPRQPRDRLTPDAWAALIDSAGYEFEEIKEAFDAIALRQTWIALSDVVDEVKRARARAADRVRADALAATPLGQAARSQGDPRPLREQIEELLDREWPGRPETFRGDPAARREARLRGLARRQAAESRQDAAGGFDDQLDGRLAPGQAEPEPASDQ